MSPDGAHPASKHGPTELAFLDRLLSRQLMDFRNYKYSRAYITSHAGQFLNHDWVDVPGIKDHLNHSASAAAAGAFSTRPNASPEDQVLVDGLSVREVTNFRNYVYSSAFITSNPALFLDHEWIEISALREFLSNKQSGMVPGLTTVLFNSIPVKIEPPNLSPISIKPEPQATSLPGPGVAKGVQLRSLIEGGREVFELISESEPEPDSEVEVGTPPIRPSSRASSITMYTDTDDFNLGGQSGTDDFRDGASDVDDHDGNVNPIVKHDDSDKDDPRPSNTLWQDDITSSVRTGRFTITQKIKVQRLEYLSEIPSIWPIPRSSTAFVIDLDDEKHNIINPDTGDLMAVDRIIRNADNDAWKSAPGSGDSKSMVRFAPGEPLIECRRSRSLCRGMFFCEHINPELLARVAAVSRFELDPSSRTTVLAAEAETRRNEGTTPEQHAAIFMTIIQNTKCDAFDSKGKRCTGGPILKAKPQVLRFIPRPTGFNSLVQGSSRGHMYFVACSGWNPKFKDDHRTHQIPDHVDENLLARFLAGMTIADGDEKDTKPCSKFVHPRTGFRQHFCPHSHIKDGQQVRGKIVQRTCTARRAIYVPVDTSIRKALIVHNDTGHNHPMPTLIKASFSTKETYKKLIQAVGVVGATVSKVDNAPSTKVILGGKSVTAFAPSLHSKRTKRDILRQVKTEQFPNGLDATGAFSLYLNGLTKPLPERYIHSYITTPDGGICILTSVPFLLKLLDDPGVTSFDGDTTFKRIEGNMNEWELSVFAKVVLRAASLVRAYINRASADFFEKVFDELQRVKLMVTGKPIGLKKLIPGGNLLVMNSDMDGAQILGFTRSAMKHNVFEHSIIPNDTPAEQVAPEFVKICWRHAKEYLILVFTFNLYMTPFYRPVNDFKTLVSADDFSRLQNFVYIDSKESLRDFSAFVNALGVKKIQDWWRHKEMHEWIIPCLVKSQSRLSADVWDSTPSTTNTNEAQHAWTNAQTGIKLTLVEGLETGYKVETVADEIETSMRTGIFSNPNNEIFHREARNSQRRSAQARKARESQVVSDESAELREKIAAELEGRRESNARTKEFNEQLKKLTGASGSRKAKSTGVLTASSSGRVKAVAPRAGPSRRTSASHSDNVSAPHAGPSLSAFSAHSDNISAVPSSLNDEVNIESDKATTTEAGESSQAPEVGGFIYKPSD
ncbi:hypothetical protein B0H16DRAFT_1832003 [Mycena metata]|uniref:Uncharacterized protein n=1 Tax=Mycena metata TaxID=1033252 RepID=A0AAD7DXI7_9AGAR|nr:hypothetical protein B0H16DRAFT_1832003 [Mycena metata]